MNSRCKISSALAVCSRKEVIIPIEEFGEESKITPWKDFGEWFIIYKESRRGSDTNGSAHWELPDGNTAITFPILKTYNKENPNNKIHSLPDLARSIASETGKEYKEIYVVRSDDNKNVRKCLVWAPNLGYLVSQGNLLQAKSLTNDEKKDSDAG